MASEVLLVNPRKRGTRRRRARPAARRRASPRQRTAAKRRRRRNPIGPFARSGMGMYVKNPRRKRRASSRRRNPIRARRRARYRRNPSFRGIINSMVMPAAIAGMGALSLDVAMGYVPLPENLKSGPLRHVVKGVGAIVLGMLVGKVTSKRTGDTMALGALTVTAYNAFREMAATYAPGLTLGYYSAGANAGYDPQLGYYVASPNMITQGGESHVSPNSELGYYVQEGTGSNY